MPRLLVVSHCPSANVEKMRDAVLGGARDPSIQGVSVEARSAFDTETEHVLEADGLILGTTENFGYMSGAIKDFFERIYPDCLERTQGRPWALFVKAGQDGSGAVSSVYRIVQGLRWREVQAPVVCVGSPDTDMLERCAELGQTLAAGLEAGIY